MRVIGCILYCELLPCQGSSRYVDTYVTVCPKTSLSTAKGLLETTLFFRPKGPRARKQNDNVTSITGLCFLSTRSLHALSYCSCTVPSYSMANAWRRGTRWRELEGLLINRFLTGSPFKIQRRQLQGRIYTTSSPSVSSYPTHHTHLLHVS